MSLSSYVPEQLTCAAHIARTRQASALYCGYRIDILVENQLIVELKSVEEIRGIPEAQLLTYMKLAGMKIGLLMNFNVTKLKGGIKRFVV